MALRQAAGTNYEVARATLHRFECALGNAQDCTSPSRGQVQSGQCDCIILCSMLQKLPV
jgi:hypothetical protein